MTHSASYWQVRCIEDTSSEDENTPPNQQRDGYQGRANRLKVEGVESDSGTATPPGLSPQRAKGVRLPKAVTNPPPGDEPSDNTPATPPPERNPRSPTTSSPMLLETPPTPPPRSRPRPQLRERRQSRQDRRSAAAPYSQRRATHPGVPSPSVNPRGVIRTSPRSTSSISPSAARSRDRFVAAAWPHLRTQFNPTGLAFPVVPRFGWCNSCCPYDAKCGNSVAESPKVVLAKNLRTRQLVVVAGEDIEAGEVLGQYLDEFEQVSVAHAQRPRNGGYRLLMTQRPERPRHPIRVRRWRGFERWGIGVKRPLSSPLHKTCAKETRSPLTTAMTYGSSTAVAWTIAATAPFRTSAIRRRWSTAEEEDVRSSAERTRFAPKRKAALGTDRNFDTLARGLTLGENSLAPNLLRITGCGYFKGVSCGWMAKLSGSTNYKSPEVRRLLTLVEKYLPLGKDEWERLAVSFNSNRGRSIPKRDYESLRRKFKVLYSTREDAFSDDSRMGGSAATNPRSFVTAASSTIHADESRVLDEESNTSTATIQTVESGGSFTELLHSATVHEGLEAFASTPRPSPLVGRSSRLQLRSSNRLGGRDLAELRGTLGRKRAVEGDDELVEASYAKAKRVKAAKATDTLKQRLGDLENTSGNMGGNVFEMILIMREENERRAEARRMDEDQRRRDEISAREARYLVEKSEAEDRRRQEKLELEDRSRRDKEEARARVQEMMLFIGALAKKD
ncbi:hypothetical protein GQ600_18232 [Phytophthora cactorum]|nr:hypothetical protein GQ600_18232 [Phytophthora cactorum]